MKLIRFTSQHAALFPKGCILTIGNFDGIHLGHQALLLQLKRFQETLQLPTVVMIFEPHPKEYFATKKGIAPVARLNRLRDKWQVFKKEKIDAIICIPFNEKFAALSPEQFVVDVLIAQFNVKAIVIGDDFRFGAQQKGDYVLLKQLSEQLDFSVTEVPTVIYDDIRISSTRIRDILKQGQMELACKLLGRPYSISGRVVHGDGRGKHLGFPTANINCARQLLPISGIFVVQVKGLQHEMIQGVASVGTRPTFAGQKICLEVFLFDFNDSIYGCHLQIDFLHFLREERFFSSADALVEQMHQDANDAKLFFSKNF